MAESYFKNEESDYSRIFRLIHKNREEKMEKRFLPRFSLLSFLAQMPHMDIYGEVEKLKSGSLSDVDREEVDYRSQYAKGWLSKYAPEDYKYDLSEEIVPEVAKNFSARQKEGLGKILEYIKSQETLDGQELHSKVHEIKTEMQIEPKELFSAIYLSFLGRDRGPKVGWFLSVLDKKFLEKRLEEVIRICN
jgi:lysyl-tRNA synthetase class 1